MIEKVLEKKYIVLLFYIAIVLLFYSNTIGAGMVFDFNGWTYLYQAGTYKDVLNSFGYPGLHQMEQLAFFSIYKLIKFNHFGWYFIFSVLHGFSGFMAFIFLKNWLSELKIKNFEQIAFISSFLFLLSPMAADVVVNKVTIHYLMSNIFIFGGLNFVVLNFKSLKVKYIIFTVVLFVLALFSLEISYVFPVLYFLILFSLYYFNDKINFNLKLILKFIFPFFILIAFLILHKFMIGSMVGHYGGNVHLHFDISDIFTNVVRYFASYIVYFDYWNYKYKDFATVLLKENTFIILSLVIGLVFAFSFYSLKKYLKNNILIVLIFCLAIVSLAPIANLYFAYMFPIENNRYSYLSSVFIYLLIVLFIYTFLRKNNLRLLVMSLFLMVNVYFLIENNNKFSKSSKLTWGLLNDFRWFDKDVIILEDPDNFNGAKMFSTLKTPTSFSESLLLHTGIDRRKNIKLVYQMNFGTLNDSVNVTKLSELEYKVELAQWGNWFWKDMIGASSYENEWCKVKVNKEGLNYYTLKLKSKSKNTVLIYAAGDKWTEVK